MQKNVLKNWDAIAKGQSCVGQMAKAVGADTIPIDIGIYFALLDVALSIYQGKTTFDDIRIGQYERLS